MTNKKTPADKCQSIHAAGNKRVVMPSPDAREVVRRKITNNAEAQCSNQTIIDG
jgi:hypothetical protein